MPVSFPKCPIKAGVLPVLPVGQITVPRGWYRFPMAVKKVLSPFNGKVVPVHMSIQTNAARFSTGVVLF